MNIPVDHLKKTNRILNFMRTHVFIHMEKITGTRLAAAYEDGYLVTSDIFKILTLNYGFKQSLDWNDEDDERHIRMAINQVIFNPFSYEWQSGYRKPLNMPAKCCYYSPMWTCNDGIYFGIVEAFYDMLLKEGDIQDINFFKKYMDRKDEQAFNLGMIYYNEERRKLYDGFIPPFTDYDFLEIFMRIIENEEENGYYRYIRYNYLP